MARPAVITSKYKNMIVNEMKTSELSTSQIAFKYGCNAVVAGRWFKEATGKARGRSPVQKKQVRSTNLTFEDKLRVQELDKAKIHYTEIMKLFNVCKATVYRIIALDLTLVTTTNITVDEHLKDLLNSQLDIKIKHVEDMIIVSTSKSTSLFINGIKRR